MPKHACGARHGVELQIGEGYGGGADLGQVILSYQALPRVGMIEGRGGSLAKRMRGTRSRVRERPM